MSKRKKTSKVGRASAIAYWSEAAFLSFTEDLLKRLDSEGVNQAELARRVGVSRGYLSRVFRGLENLTLETMTKLALGVKSSVRLHVAPIHQVTRWYDVQCVNDVVAIEFPDSGVETVQAEATRSAPITNAGKSQAVMQ